MRFSFVIPAHDEQDSIEELHAEIAAVMHGITEDYEVIFVDDGSSDATFDRMAQLHYREARVRVIRLAANFGKAAAYQVGFEAAEGEIIVTMDADLQDDPAELPKLLTTLETGYDLVGGWKQSRLGNEPHKALPSRFFNLLIYALFGLRLHDSNCGYRVMRRQVAKTLDLYEGSYRFIPELAHARGYRVGEAPVEHRRRQHGHSKYGPMRFWTGMMDMFAVRFITGFRQRPLQFFGALAMPPLVAGVGLEVYVLYMKLVVGEPFAMHLAALIIGVLMLLLGVQIAVTGLVGEMLAANSPRQPHAVRAVLGLDETPVRASTRPPQLSQIP